MAAKHSLEQIINRSKDLFKICSLNDAFVELAENKLVVNSIWSQMDIEKNERTKFQKTYFFELDSSLSKPKLLFSSQPQPLRSDVWNVKSPNNKSNAVVVNWKENGEDKQFLELWENGSRTKNLNLSKLDKHGKVYERSGQLGSFAWSSDSTKLAYVAEKRKLGKEKCLFNSKVAGSSDEKDLLNENNYEQKYANYFNDDWGEQMVGKADSVIALFDTLTNELKTLDNMSENFIPGQVIWHANRGLVINAYYTKPFKLGLIYCPIRKSELFYYDLDENKLTQLTDFKTEALRDPRMSNDYENICWLQNQACGAHFQCSKLMIMNLKTKEIRTLVDIVREYPKQETDFPGIFATNFPYNNCWSLDNKRILINTIWKSSSRLIAVDVDTGKVTDLNKGMNQVETCNVLKIENDWICAALQGYNKRPSLMLAKLPEHNLESNIRWTLSETEKDGLSDLAYVELIKFTPTNPNLKFPNVDFEAVLVEARNRNDTLVVFPHGGPHSAFAGDYSPHVAIFYALGFSVLLINYRGSAGFGQDAIDSLPGHISIYDVEDCQQAAEFAMKKYNFKYATVYGGSHGGFLTTQLVGQYPEFYSAAAARNPVTHLESMLFSTDIPDWCIFEAYGEYKEFDFKTKGSAELWTRLFEKSPIYHVDKVKTPVLLMIGQVDLRVPPAQGVEYYKALLARNVTTRLLQFREDNHPLDKPQTTADCIAHTILWFEKYTTTQ